MESTGIFKVEYVGQIPSPKANGCWAMMTQDEGSRLAGEIYTYEGAGVWVLFAGGGAADDLSAPIRIVVDGRGTGDEDDAAFNDAAFETARALAVFLGVGGLEIRPGYYAISDTVDLTGISEVVGGGSKNTVVFWKPGVSGTGKAMVTIREKSTHMRGVHWQGDAVAHAPDTGIDFQPQPEKHLQSCTFDDVWCFHANVGLWSHDQPGGVQHEFISFQNCSITGYTYGIHFDKIHCDGWTFNNSWIGHTAAGGASMRMEVGSGGFGLHLTHTWLLGPNVGTSIEGAWDDIQFEDAGAEGPTYAIDCLQPCSIRLRGAGIGGRIRIAVNQTLTINSQQSQWFAATFSPPIFELPTGAAVVWKSVQDKFYLEVIETQWTLQTQTLDSFLAAAMLGQTGNLAFSYDWVLRTILAQSVRIGGQRTNWFEPAGVPRHQVIGLVPGNVVTDVVATSGGGGQTANLSEWHASDGTTLLADIDKDGLPHVGGFPLGRLVSVPASAAASGRPADFAVNASFLYVCVATDTWQRMTGGFATW